MPAAPAGCLARPPRHAAGLAIGGQRGQDLPSTANRYRSPCTHEFSGALPSRCCHAYIPDRTLPCRGHCHGCLQGTAASRYHARRHRGEPGRLRAGQRQPRQGDRSGPACQSTDAVRTSGATDVLRPRALRLRPHVVCDVPRSGSRLRPAQRPVRADRRCRHEAIGHARGSDIDVQGLHRAVLGRIPEPRHDQPARARRRHDVGRPRQHHCRTGRDSAARRERDGQRKPGSGGGRDPAGAVCEPVPPGLWRRHLPGHAACLPDGRCRVAVLPDRGPQLSPVLEQVRSLPQQQDRRYADRSGDARPARVRRSEQGQLRGLPSDRRRQRWQPGHHQRLLVRRHWRAAQSRHSGQRRPRVLRHGPVRPAADRPSAQWAEQGQRLRHVQDADPAQCSHPSCVHAQRRVPLARRGGALLQHARYRSGALVSARCARQGAEIQRPARTVSRQHRRPDAARWPPRGQQAAHDRGRAEGPRGLSADFHRRLRGTRRRPAHAQDQRACTGRPAPEDRLPACLPCDCLPYDRPHTTVPHTTVPHTTAPHTTAAR